MIFIFPLIYVFSFLFAIKEIIKGNKQAFLLFLIFGLPIYATTLSILYSTEFKGSIAFIQLLKEFIILLILGISIWNLKTKIIFHVIDYLVMIFFIYTLVYVLLPVGEQGLFNRIVAFKSTSFVAIIYFAGRLFNPRTIYINKYFHYILLMFIFAGLIMIVEIVTNRHIQLLTGYANYNENFLNFAATGDEGLTFSFETEVGFKRFASFFSNPLEYAAASLITLAVIAGLYTRDDYKFMPDHFGKIALAFTLVVIFFTISRAAFASYFLMIYMYALLTNKKFILYALNFCIITGIILLFFVIKNDNIQQLIINTLNFTDSSSIGHVLDWIEGITAMIENPLGLGLGSSGRVAVTLDSNIGGHNQFLIIGVQTGIIAMSLYLAIYIGLVKTAWHWLYRLNGKAKKVCLVLLLVKIGLFIPLFTSEMEASPYISYVTWFLSGLFMSIVADQIEKSKNIGNPVTSYVNPLTNKA